MPVLVNLPFKLGSRDLGVDFRTGSVDCEDGAEWSNLFFRSFTLGTWLTVRGGLVDVVDGVGMRLSTGFETERWLGRGMPRWGSAVVAWGPLRGAPMPFDRDEAGLRGLVVLAADAESWG